jgi:hypothetical protein
VVHDFKVPGLGYISYEGQDLDWNLVKDDIMAVNPDFKFYTNERRTADIWTIGEVEAGKAPFKMDADLRARMEYTWSTERRTWRGILYAVPEPLDESFKLKALETQ